MTDPARGQGGGATLPVVKDGISYRWGQARERVRQEGIENSWYLLVEDLGVRLIKPIYSVPFIMYLVTGVCLLGGVAIWVEVVRYWSNVHFYDPKTGMPEPTLDAVLAAIHTFYPALAWSATMQIVLTDTPKDENDPKPHKRLRAFALFIGSIVLMLAVVALALSDVLTDGSSFILGILGVLLAIMMWWIANAEDDTWKDGPTNVGLDPKGGPAEPNTALPGNTAGFDFGDGT